MRNTFFLVVASVSLLFSACGNTKPQPPRGAAPPEEGKGRVAPSTAGTSGAALLKALESPDESARLAAIDSLGRQGATIEGAVPALVKQLGDDSALVRAHAAHALGQIGSAAKPAAEALAKLVFDKEASVRREAIKAYRSIRPGPEISIPLFTKLLEEADPPVRIQVMRAMAEEGKRVVPALIEALGNEKAAYWACLVLSDIGPDAAEAVPALVKLFQASPQPEVCREAVLALAAIGPAAADAVPALMGVLDDEDTLLDLPAVYALGAIGPKAKAAEAKLKKLSEDEKSPPFLKTVCLWALARMNPGNEDLVREVVPHLVAALEAPEPRVRAAAARALIDLNPDPEIVRPVLQKAMEDASPEALNDILDALASLGEKAVPRLIKALEEEKVRAKAAAIIARIGPPAKEAVPALVKALEDKNPETRNEVLFALAAIGPDAAEAVPAIRQALKDPDAKVCYAACYALGKIGPAAESAKADLAGHLSDDDEFMCMACAWALAQIDPKSPETAAKTVPVLIKALQAPDPPTRLHAAEALELLGPLAADAAPALKKLGDDPDEAVRAAAAQALKAIGR
jgi:HEAT repeat protein